MLALSANPYATDTCKMALLPHRAKLPLIYDDNIISREFKNAVNGIADILYLLVSRPVICFYSLSLWFVLKLSRYCLIMFTVSSDSSPFNNVQFREQASHAPISLQKKTRHGRTFKMLNFYLCLGEMVEFSSVLTRQA